MVFRQAGDAAGGQVAGEAELQRDPGAEGVVELERGSQQGSLSRGLPASSSALPAQPCNAPAAQQTRHARARAACTSCCAHARGQGAPQGGSSPRKLLLQRRIQAAQVAQPVGAPRQDGRGLLCSTGMARGRGGRGLKPWVAWFRAGQRAGKVARREGNLGGRAVSKCAKQVEAEAQAAERAKAGKGN